MNLKDVPGRVFLDTCVVNFIIDHVEEIHDNVVAPGSLDSRAIEDIEALSRLFVTGQRAQWQLAVSPYTYSEIMATRDPKRLSTLDGWFQDLWQCWRFIVGSDKHLPSFIEADAMRVHLLTSGSLNVLPDVADRVLICDAYVYRCDLFCTRDWTTIIKHRSKLSDLPFDIVTPSEWWYQIRQFEALWA